MGNFQEQRSREATGDIRETATAARVGHSIETQEMNELIETRQYVRVRRQMETRVNSRIKRNMQEHTLIERVYSDDSANENIYNEEEATDKCEGAMNLAELQEIIKQVEWEVATEKMAKHMEALVCNMVRSAPTKKRKVTGTKRQRGLAMYCTLPIAICEDG